MPHCAQCGEYKSSGIKRLRCTRKQQNLSVFTFPISRSNCVIFRFEVHFLLFGQRYQSGHGAFVAITVQVLILIGVHGMEVRCAEFGHGIFIGFLGHGLVRRLCIVVIHKGQEGNGLQPGLVQLQNIGDIQGFFRFESDGCADLIVGPVILDLSHIFHLFPNAHIVFAAEEEFFFHRKIAIRFHWASRWCV